MPLVCCPCARHEAMDPYTPTYCVRCAQLQWRHGIGKRCEFCGHLFFAPVRPKPTFTAIDRRILKAPPTEKDKDTA